MTNVFLKSSRERTAFAKFLGIFRSARTREAEAIVARYATGRLSDSAEREMTEKLLHIGDSFRF